MMIQKYLTCVIQKYLIIKFFVFNCKQTLVSYIINNLVGIKISKHLYILSITAV